VPTWPQVFPGLRVVDVADPTRPQEVAAYETGAYATRAVINGNQGTFIAMAGYECTNNLILGSCIGVTPDGVQPLDNGTGIPLHVDARRTFIASATDGERNLIADSDSAFRSSSPALTTGFWATTSVRRHRQDAVGQPLGPNPGGGVCCPDDNPGKYHRLQRDRSSDQGAGVHIACAVYHTLRWSYSNSKAGSGIVLANCGHQMLHASAIVPVTESTVSGTVCAGCAVEIFLNGESEGRIYEGTTIAYGSGHFTLGQGSPLAGPYLTATATDADGNTSEFPVPHAAGGTACLPLVLRSR
jgi:hypothetical protein